MAKKRKRGRPKGSKNKIKKADIIKAADQIITVDSVEKLFARAIKARTEEMEKLKREVIKAFLL